MVLSTLTPLTNDAAEDCEVLVVAASLGNSPLLQRIEAPRSMLGAAGEQWTSASTSIESRKGAKSFCLLPSRPDFPR